MIKFQISQTFQNAGKNIIIKDDSIYINKLLFYEIFQFKKLIKERQRNNNIIIKIIS